MKKIFLKLALVIILISGIVFTSNAQEVGIRFGGLESSGGISLDAIYKAGEYSRFHADLGFYKNGVSLEFLWDFVNRPIANEALNWYFGIGPTTYFGNNYWLGLSGEVGLEYRLDAIPIVFGFDWRPTYWFANDEKFGADSFGLNLRIVF